MVKLVLFVLALIFLAAGHNFSQTAPGLCSGIATEFKFGFPKESPVVYGEEFKVPAVNLSFLSDIKHRAQDKPVVVRYIWEWFEYPYQNEVFGAWSDAYEVLRCRTDDRGRVTVEGYTVRPRGWSKLISQRAKPKFKGLEISLIDDAVRSSTFLVPAKKLKGDQVSLRFSLETY